MPPWISCPPVPCRWRKYASPEVLQAVNLSLERRVAREGSRRWSSPRLRRTERVVEVDLANGVAGIGAGRGVRRRLLPVAETQGSRPHRLPGRRIDPPIEES